MRYSLRSLAVPFAVALLTYTGSVLMAQQTRPRPPAGAQPGNPQPRQPQPAGRGTPVTQTAAQRGQGIADVPAESEQAVEEISEELAEVLREWEWKSSQIKSLHGTHKRTVYNLVFEVEKIATGKFFLETPDKGRIDLVGVKPKRDEKSARIGRSGKPFRLEEDRAEKWICTGDEIVMINDDDKSYEVIPLPEHAKGKNIVNSPLPFLFGMKADEARRRFRMTLKSNSKTAAFLIVNPRQQTDLQNYTEAWIMLEKANYLPTAVKLFDPSGTLETVYKFDGVKINDKGILRGVVGFFGGTEKDPFRPNLKSDGYKLVLPTMDHVEAPRKSAMNDPRFNSQPTRSTNQTRPQDTSRPLPFGNRDN